MPDTIPQQPAVTGDDLLAEVKDLRTLVRGVELATGAQVRGATAQIRPQASGKPILPPLARLDVEQAREFVMKLDERTAGADLPAAMFLLGRLAEHAQALLDVIDATTAVTR